MHLNSSDKVVIVLAIVLAMAVYMSVAFSPIVHAILGLR